MKIKVKGLVFVGAAAAIMLSAGAASASISTGTGSQQATRSAADAGVVTSQKYTEGRYEWYDNKEGEKPADNSADWTSVDKYPSMNAITGMIVTNAAATGESGWGSDGYTYSDKKVPSENTVHTALNALEETIGGASAKQPYNETGKKQVADPDGGWASISTAVIEHTGAGAGNYVDISGPDTNGAIALDIDAAKIQSSNATNNDVNTQGNATKLATAGVVQIKQTADKYQVSKNKEWTDASGAVAGGTYVDVDKTTRTDGGVDLDIKSAMIQSNNITADVGNNIAADNVNVLANASKLATAGVVQRKQTATDTYQVSLNKEWTNLSNAVAVNDNNYITKTANGDGSVTLGLSAATDAAAIGNASSSSSTTLVTDYAVKQYVSTTGLGGTLNAMPAACGYAGAHCALVSSVGQNGIELTWTPMAGAEGTAPANP